VAVTMFGITNCDTIKRAKIWLDDNDIAFAFHDYKKAGVDRRALQAWVDELGWEVLLNRAGTTFRGLPDADKLGIDANKAIALMIAYPSLIKRPVLDIGERRIVGFKPETYSDVFGES